MTELDPGVLRGARVLITGGLGFIGSNLAIRLVELGADVTVVDSLIPEYGGNRFNVAPVAGKLSVNVSDVRDVSRMRELVRRQDYLFNLAGQTSHLDSMTDPYTDLDINCGAQLSILESCRHENPSVRIVFASTRQVYGKPDRLPVDEKHPCRPTDVNGIHKLTGEAYHLLYHQVYDLQTCALRLTNTYGPRMRIKDARQTFVGIWLRAVIEGKPFEVWGGEQLRDFTYVDDAVEAFLLAAVTPETAGRAFNVGGEEVLSLRQLAEALGLAAGGDAKFAIKEFPAERKRIDIGDYYADDKLFRSVTGWRAQTPIREGLARSLAFFRENFSHYV